MRNDDQFFPSVRFLFSSDELTRLFPYRGRNEISQRFISPFHHFVCNAESSAIVRKNSICGLVSMYCGKVRAIVIDYFSCNPIAKPTFNAIHDIVVPSIADSFQKIPSGPNCWRIQSRSNVQDGVSLRNIRSDIYIYIVYTHKYSNSRNVPFFQFLFLPSPRFPSRLEER